MKKLLNYFYHTSSSQKRLTTPALQRARGTWMQTNNARAQPHPCHNSKCPLASAKPAGSAVASIMATIKPIYRAQDVRPTYTQTKTQHKPNQSTQLALAQGCPEWTKDQRSAIVAVGRPTGWALGREGWGISVCASLPNQTNHVPSSRGSRTRHARNLRFLGAPKQVFISVLEVAGMS